MTNMAMVEFIKRFMDIDEDYILKKWTFQHDKTKTIKFSGDLIPKGDKKYD